MVAFQHAEIIIDREQGRSCRTALGAHTEASVDLPVEDRRRPYRLTATGHRMLRQRLESLRAVTRIAASRLAEG